MILITGIALSATAQQPGERPYRKIVSPESIAREKTVRLKEELQLTDKQYDKIYKMLLKEEKKHVEKQMNRPEPSPDFREMPPHGHGERNGSSGHRHERNGQGETRMPSMSRERPSRPEMKKETEKERAKAATRREKKMKKILTPEQFEKWQSMTSGAPQKEMNPPYEEEFQIL